MNGDVAAARKHRDIVRELNPAWAVNQIGAIELIDGDFDEAQRLFLAEYQESPSAQRLTRAYFAAIRDPSLTDEFLALNREIDPNRDDDIQGAGFWDSTPLLYSLGEVDEALDSMRGFQASGRGLRVTNGLGMIWNADTRATLAHPSLAIFFEELGMTDYWREHGDPDYCRVTGDSVECATE